MRDAGNKTVLVVGGGLAGIAASIALARNGVSVKLLESRRRLGGRTGSFTIADDADATAETVDYCQHVGMGCCTNLKQLVRWLGQEDAWSEHASLHFYSSAGDYRRLSALPVFPAPLHLLGWLAFWPNLGLRDRLAIAKGLRKIHRLKIDEALEQQQATDWLRDHGQTESCIRHFWSTIVVSALGEELARVNLAAVCKVLQDGFLNHRRAFHLMVPKRPLDELFNLEATEKLRQLGVAVEFGAPVTQISRRQGQVYVASRNAMTHNADALVLAIPWNQLPKLTVDASVPRFAETARLAGQLEASPITGIHTWWDQDWMPHSHAAIVGRLCQWVFADASASGGPPYYYQIVISASRRLPKGNPSEIAQLLKEDLAEVFPASREANLLRLKVVTDPASVFSVSPKSLECRASTEALGNEIFLAGDWTRSGWPATMEGAVLSGFRAAESLLRSWGHPKDICAAPLNGKNA